MLHGLSHYSRHIQLVCRRQGIIKSMSVSSSRSSSPRPSFLDNVEKVHGYRKGGFHPVHLNTTFASGRYRVLHKLGHGGFSTVWLARDELLKRLVSLKIVVAEASENCRELRILQHLKESPVVHPGRNHAISIVDRFTVDGPNGSHVCLVSQVAGPTTTQISFSPGMASGSKRLRGDVARLFARQTAEAIGFLHAAGVVHKDITASNVLIRLADIDSWSDEEVYKRLRSPVKHEIQNFSGNPPRDNEPNYIVEPVDSSQLDSALLDKNVLVVDFGESFFVGFPPPEGTGTPLSYCPPPPFRSTVREQNGSTVRYLGACLHNL